MRIHSDWEMTVRIASHYRIAYLEKPLMNMYRHDESCTAMSLADTRTPDDLEIWLGHLDRGKLPYTLDRRDRMILETSMVKMVLGLLQRALSKGSTLTAESCLKFLVRRRVVPFYEKLRYAVAYRLLKRGSGLSNLILKRTRLSGRLWPLENRIKLKLPAPDPISALIP